MVSDLQRGISSPCTMAGTFGSFLPCCRRRTKMPLLPPSPDPANCEERKDKERGSLAACESLGGAVARRPKSSVDIIGRVRWPAHHISQLMCWICTVPLALTHDAARDCNVNTMHAWRRYMQMLTTVSQSQQCWISDLTKWGQPTIL